MSKFNFLKEYFNLSKTEKAGLWLLLVILVVIIIFSKLSFYYKSDIKKTDFSEYEKQISEWRSSISQDDSYLKRTYTDLDAPQFSATKSKLTPFPFDPNNIDAAGLKSLGLADRQIKSILNYRQKGGVFYIKSDFAKIYTISRDEYNVLEPYISLPISRETRKSFENKKFEKKEVAKVELNSADTAALRKIRGIGPAFSMRIVKYRNLLGGFVNVNQLKEVKGIDSLKYAEISPYMFVNPYIIRKININTVTFEELKKHPYFGYNISLSIINYRKQHGDYTSITDLKKLALITDEVYNRIAPYLTI